MEHVFTPSAIRKFSAKAAGFLSMMSLVASGAGAQRSASAEEGVTPAATSVTSLFRFNGNALNEAHSISITANFSQRYASVANNVTATGMQFGTQQHTGGPDPISQNAWVDMANVSGATNDLFTGSPSAKQGTGVDVKSSYALSLFNTTRPLALAGLPTAGRETMGRLRLSFSEPVSNPVLHIVGLGGAVNNLGITTELQLMTAGVTMTKLSGNSNLDVTANQIRNSAANPDGSSLSGAATGSVCVAGKNITTLEFEVYLRGDGNGADWENAGSYNGDRWLLGFSLADPATATDHIVYTNLQTPAIAESGAMPSSRPANSPTVLPIYVTGITATPAKNSCGALLRWNTATEIGLTGFDIEQSADGNQFNTIAQMAVNGQSAGESYSYTAGGLNSGVNYFRLHVNNSTAQQAYSKTVMLNVDCEALKISAAPNPATDILNIRGLTAGNMIVLMDASGRSVLSRTAEGVTATLNLRDMPAGLYILAVRDAAGKYAESVRVSKQ